MLNESGPEDRAAPVAHATTVSPLERYKVLAAGICSLILTLGPGRFAYTPLLPLMQHQANLGVAAAGWLASINYAGYLSGALLVSLLSDLELKDCLYRSGLVLAVATTWMMGSTDSFAGWAVSRYLAGLSGAAGMLLGSGLILNWLIRHDFRHELGVHFAGVGLAIVVSAGAVMAMNHLSVDWRQQWFWFAMLGTVLLVPAWAWLPSPAGATVASASRVIPDVALNPLFFRLLLSWYFCAGIGYVVSATFIVAIIDRLSHANGHGTFAFLVIGVTAAPSCALWDLIARRLGNLNAMILAAAVQIAGIVLPVFSASLMATVCGAAMFGGTVMGIVSLVLTMTGRYYPSRPATVMGRMTVVYSLAQAVAPAVIGTLAAHWGGYQTGLYVAATVMAVGIVVLLAARRVGRAAVMEPSGRGSVY